MTQETPIDKTAARGETERHYRLWVKVPKAALSEEKANHLRALDGFRVVADGHVFRSVRYHEVSAHCLKMEHFRGSVVSDILSQSGSRWVSAKRLASAQKLVHLAGCWLGYFHKWRPSQRASHYDLHVLAQRAIDQVDVLRNGGLPSNLADRLIDTIEQAIPGEVGDRVVSVHGDFKPGNLMISGHEVIGIDMEGYGWGSPLTDLGSFIASTAVLRSAHRFRGVSLGHRRLLCREFLGAYRSVTEWDIQGLPLQVLKSIVFLCGYMTRHQNPLLWWLRGRPTMVQTISEALDHPFVEE